MRRKRIAQEWGNARRRNTSEGDNTTALHGKAGSRTLGVTGVSSPINTLVTK